MTRELDDLLAGPERLLETWRARADAQGIEALAVGAEELGQALATLFGPSGPPDPTAARAGLARVAEPGGPEERLATAKALLACLEDALDGDPAALRELRRRADAVELALVRAAPLAERPEAFEDPDQALGESERLYLSLFRHAAEAILLLDADLTVVAANRSARRLFRGKAPSLRGLNLRDLLAEGADEAAGRLHRLQPGERTALDLEGLGPDGSFSARAAASRLDLERSDSFHLLVRDRSERLRLEDELAEQRGRAEDMEVTLRNVLSATGEAERDFRRDLAGRVEREVLPVIRRIVDEPDRSRRAGYRRALTDSLLGLAQGGSTSLDARLLCLTPAEIDVCRLVQGGASSREAARELGVTFDTIQTHRRSIRRKLGLRGTPTSLCAFLKTIPPIP